MASLTVVIWKEQDSKLKKVIFQLFITLWKDPLLGVPDDGSITTFDYVWDGTKKNNGMNYHNRTSTLTDGFLHYMKDYYYDAKVFG